MAGVLDHEEVQVQSVMPCDTRTPLQDMPR